MSRARHNSVLGGRFISASVFGAKFDGTTEDHVALQAANDYAEAHNIGYVLCPDGEAIIGDTVIQSSNVIFKGVGRNLTGFKAKDGLNKTMFKSKNFDDLTGQNKWLVSDGVQYGLGFEDLYIDGNKANQTAGKGVEYYAKGLCCRNIIIKNCYSDGWYSEAGDVPGQIDFTDLPEGYFEKVWFRGNGGYGALVRGPHDCSAGHLVANENTLDNIRFERSPGVYSGAWDVDQIHTYASTAKGLSGNASSSCRIKFLITESNHQEGLDLDGWFWQIGQIQSYINCRTSGSFAITVDGSKNIIGTIQHKDSGESIGGVLVNGNHNHIGGGFLSGENSDGIGLHVVGSRNRIKLNIEDYDGSGGIALKTGTGAYNNIDLIVEDCETMWNSTGAPAGGSYKIKGTAAVTGYVGFTGTWPRIDHTTSFDVTFHNSVDAYKQYSSIVKRSGSTFAADATGAFSFTIEHEGFTTPNVDRVNLQLKYTDSGGGTSFGDPVGSVECIGADATDITVKGYMTTAASAGALGYVLATITF